MELESTLPPDAPNRTSCARNTLGIKKSSFSVIVRSIGFHPYRYRLRPALKDVHKQQRIQFSQWISTLTFDDLKHTVFSDEANFTLTGAINRQNCVIYAHKKNKGGVGKPKSAVWTTEKHPNKVMVFLAIFRHQPFALTFFESEERMNSEMYLELLKKTVIPELTWRNGGTLENIFWTQDGAPCHRSQEVMEYLDQKFGDHVIGLNSIRGQVWPPQSPDLNPLDFCIWGYLKSKVYFPRPKTLTELKTRIQQEISLIPMDMIGRAVNSLKGRA